ncbi:MULTISPECIES: hypothetical protein [unclassified Streptomyces]|uniref:hypothetical protein n=1 Tax=unclassified Streptomyces TaxID=2593676 RepID=UPI00093B2565|nr:hypothetical protein [Streptomyces sp. TSRI0281]
MHDRARLPLRAATTLAAAGILAAACSAPGAGPPPAKAPRIGATPQMTGMQGKQLPIEPYLLDTDQNNTIQHARQVLVSRCMKRFGFDFAFPVPVRDDRTPNTQSEQRYISDPEVAERFGYHNPRPQQKAPAEPPLSAAGNAVLVGEREPGQPGSPSPAKSSAPPAVHRGMPIPEGGCFGEVDRELISKNVIIQESDLVIRINIGNMQRSLRDKRVLSAFRKWSACMKKQGYDYATPMDAEADPRWTRSTAPTPGEITTALADVDCMRSTNVVGVWFAVESAYEKVEIDKNAAELAEVAKNIGISLRYAATVNGRE